ncbi:uncharacterized protein LOC130799966 isoform X2 [Amaranthus tricolor]|uniref:uncharacterized protein LOC130799966 isoform X2 n=1 Tax=Amaranthus tricolor TaxID=29722 RepID=UPI00258A71B3|nr:uncharacterized protein LOC130799966 isoform X2 [Amaranthus tricolor]
MNREQFCMILRIKIDCNGCYTKVKLALVHLPVEYYMIEMKRNRVIVFGRFIPQDVAIKIRKKTNRRVEILDIQQLDPTTPIYYQDQASLMPPNNNVIHTT